MKLSLNEFGFKFYLKLSTVKPVITNFEDQLNFLDITVAHYKRG